MAARKSQPMKTIAGVGTIPQSWTVAKIGEIGRPNTPVVKTGPFGAQLQSKDFRSDGVPVLNIGNVQPGYFDIRKLDHVSPEKAQQLSTYFLNEGDLVFSRSASIGRTACCTKDMVGWLMSYHLMRLSVDQERCCPRFVMFSLMLSPVIVNQVNAITQGGTRSGINTAILENLRIAFPNLETQKSIVRVIDTLDDAIEATRAVIDQTRKLKTALLQDLLTIGLPGRHKQRKIVTHIGQMPSDWQVHSIGSLFNVELGKMLSKAAKTGMHYRRYLGNSNVKWGSFDLTSVEQMDFKPDEFRRFQLRKGDVLICEGGEVGRTAVWDDEIVDCCYQKAIHRLRPKNERSVVPLFMRYFMEHAVKSNLMARFTGESSIAHLTRETLVEIPMPVPDFDEQLGIVAALESVRCYTDALEQRERTLACLKSALGDGLLSGRIAVPEDRADGEDKS